MSPTPETIKAQNEYYYKDGTLDRAFENMIGLLRSIYREKRKIQYVSFAGFLLDDTAGIQTLHPIFLEEKEEERFFVLGGNNFGLYFPILCDVNRDDGEVEVFWCGGGGGRRQYSVKTGKLCLVNGELYCPSGNHHFGVIQSSGNLESIYPDIPIEESISLKERMVIALAAGAGLKPEDESSKEMSLLLEELKRIEAEKGK